MDKLITNSKKYSAIRVGKQCRSHTINNVQGDVRTFTVLTYFLKKGMVVKRPWGNEVVDTGFKRTH